MSAANLIPGPNSTELAIHIGHKRGGIMGLIVAGLAFILPATLIVTACAWAYLRFGTLPEAKHFLYGVKPVIIAVVLQALWGLGKTAVKTRTLAALGLMALGANYLGANELLVLFVTGAAFVILKQLGGRMAASEGASLLVGGACAIESLPRFALTPMSLDGFSLQNLFFFFAKVGSVLFGSGYVLIAFLRTDLVQRFHWLTEAQLLDAIAVGQFTPGPVFTTATFIGYLLAGKMGALVATVGIFLPAFFFVAISAPFIPRLRQSEAVGYFLDGLNVASLALMAVASFYLLENALVDWVSLCLVLGATLALLRFKINSAWLVLAGGVIGMSARSFL